MWFSRLFWKLFLAYVVLNLLSAIIFVMIVSGWQERHVVEQVERRLHDTAVILGDNVIELLPNGASRELQSRVRQLGSETGIRITLVSMSGEVLADSEKADLPQVEQMENHKDCMELVQARILGQGSSER